MSDDRRPGLVPDVDDPTPPTPETQMPALVAFVLDRLAEDEHTARAAPQEEWGPRGEIAGRSGTEMIAHIARHDPARVLADVAAKRRIVEAYVEAQQAALEIREMAWGPGMDERGRVERATYDTRTHALYGVVHMLALPHAEHEDYRPEWRP